MGICFFVNGGCAGQASAYGQCIAKNVEHLEKNACGVQFEKFQRCFKSHVWSWKCFFFPLSLVSVLSLCLSLLLCVCLSVSVSISLSRSEPFLYPLNLPFSSILLVPQIRKSRWWGFGTQCMRPSPPAKAFDSGSSLGSDFTWLPFTLHRWIYLYNYFFYLPSFSLSITFPRHLQ